ncbi:MAG: sel1 repeat family protein [Deltaproteobacteria bacterium]|nr:sel1 repeat family protein [Deltaproteobacteria bacterium]
MYNAAASRMYFSVMFILGVGVFLVLLPGFACGGCMQGRKFPEKRAGCDKGDVAQCMALGDAFDGSDYNSSLSYTFFGPDDHAAMAYQRACDLGSFDGCQKFGWQVATYELSSHAADAVKSLGHACDAKDRNSCYLLGFLVGNGMGTARDPARAAALCATSCDAGANNACYVLASFYARGLGVERDNKKEIELLKRSCSDGYQPACACQSDGRCDWDSNALRYISAR